MPWEHKESKFPYNWNSPPQMPQGEEGKMVYMHLFCRSVATYLGTITKYLTKKPRRRKEVFLLAVSINTI